MTGTLSPRISGTLSPEYSKQTDKGRIYIGKPVEAPPYPGAKLYFLVEDKFEDRDWISELIRITYRELPDSKKKQKKANYPTTLT